MPLVQEFVPSNRRGLMGGLVGIAIPLGGIVLGSSLAAFLAPTIGWRGLVLIGALPALLSLYIRTSVPESPRWSLNNGRREEAKESIAWALKIPPEEVRLPEEVPTVRTSWRELFRYPRSLAVSWLGNLGMQTATYGIVLWGPTLLVLVLGVSPAQASFMFIFVGLSAFVGRIVFALVSEAIGRKLTGGLVGFGAAIFLLLAGILPYDATLAGLSVFYLMIVLAYFFTDGGFALVGPYSAEVWPTNLRTTGMGSAYGFGGIGKVIGPAGLALIAGSSDPVNPGATIDALAPGFIYLASFGVLAGLAYLVLGIETRGKSIEEIDDELRIKGRQLVPS
jgi:putative MFS transporter